MLGADNKWTGLAVTYFGPTQANFVFPYSVIGSTAKLRMVTPLGTSDPFQVNVTPVSPGLFVSYVDAKGAEYPAAVGVTPSGAWYYLGPAAAGAAYRLAAPGDVILLYGTGFGPTTPALAGTKSVVGAAALNSPVKIYIGGNETPLAWAGVVEVDGFAQLNVAIPNLPAGTYPLQAEVGGVKTPTVLLAVGAGQ
jgi:uncharacterized protein (TIGR03437 family)